MTPRELCDLAQRINAAVPGLVPDYEVGEEFHDKYVATRDRHGWEYNPLPGAAALMLGLCWAWVHRRGDDDPPDMALVAIMECYVALRDYVQSTLPRSEAMTPTEISAAYAALHERWPELMTPYGIDYHNGIWWDIEEPVEDLVELHEELAHAACFLACLKACAEREFDVDFRTEWGNPKVYTITRMVAVDIAHPHTITEVMDRVMQLPNVTA